MMQIHITDRKAERTYQQPYYIYPHGSHTPTHPISCRFGVIAAYCSNFGHLCFEPPFGGLRGNVRGSL